MIKGKDEKNQSFLFGCGGSEKAQADDNQSLISLHVGRERWEKVSFL